MAATLSGRPAKTEARYLDERSRAQGAVEACPAARSHETPLLPRHRRAFLTMLCVALSCCDAASAKRQRLRNCQASATAFRHVVIAAARSARWVWAEMRLRCTLKVL